MNEEAKLLPGECEYCGCTEAAPCSLCRHNGTEGFFHNVLRTCCTAEPCVRQWEQACREATAKAEAERRNFVGDVRARWQRSKAELRQKRASGLKRRKKKARAA